MKIIFSLVLLTIFASLGFADQIMVSQDKILMTSQGIFININGNLAQTDTISYLGNGIYAAEYYGQCGRCGWALDKNGKCTNQNCNQYGPPRD